jgi:hypothetical protein
MGLHSSALRGGRVTMRGKFSGTVTFLAAVATTECWMGWVSILTRPCNTERRLCE